MKRRGAPPATKLKRPAAAAGTLTHSTRSCSRTSLSTRSRSSGRLTSEYERIASMNRLRRPAVNNNTAALPAKSGKLSRLSASLSDSSARGLVFDIGANFGQSAELYLALGLSVVAVEPNPLAAAAIRNRLGLHIEAGHLTVEEKAVWHDTPMCTTATLYVNEEDSEWSSMFRSCGARYDTSAKAMDVATTTLAELYQRHGVPLYVKLDTEGADGICLKQLRGLQPPPYLSFELNSCLYFEEAIGLGYNAFKVVPQGCHRAEHLKDRIGRPLTHAGEFAEAVIGAGGDGNWRTLEQALADCHQLCIVHDATVDVAEFAKGPAHFVERDFATLMACFPVESKDDEEWFDVHCRHATAKFVASQRL